MIKRLLKAEYLFRPTQLLRRQPNSDHEGFALAQLPWGRTIRVSVRDNIGPAVLRLGVYDLVVSETLWRLTDASDLAVDVGANVGCMTAVLAERARIVHSFEPHPRLFAELSENVRSFQQQGSSASIELHNEAVGEKDGVLPLSIPADFERHRGESSLLPRDGAGATTVHVQVTTLDRLFAPPTSIGVMKLDVEGFEKQVFLGAGELLKSHRIRDCVFEELRPYPTDVIAILESYGYTLYRLARGLARPRLLPGDSGEARSIWEATSFLATSQPRRALDRMGRFGWRTLGR